MKKNSVKVALLMYRLSVAQKINKARLIITKVTANSSTFSSPSPSLVTLTTATDNLEKAWNDAQDGGKNLTTLMHDKEADFLKLFNDFANYVEGLADGNEAIIHLANLDVKKTAIKNTTEFEVYQWNDSGAVGLKVKARKKTIYKWQYCKSPLELNTWVDAITTDVAHATIGDLEIGTNYCFRVVFIDGTGDHPSIVLSFAVN